MARVLFLMPTRTYRASAFLAAAESLNVEAVIGSDQRQVLEALTPGKTLTLDFRDLERAGKTIFDFNGRYPVDAIVPVDDDTALLAASGCEALSLRFNPPAAVQAAREKHRMREILSAAGQPVPRFELLSTRNSEIAAKSIDYPCVLKPVFLSASRGVIRANDYREFKAAFRRITALLKQPEIAKRGGPLSDQIIVEDYISGREVALEGLLCEGELKVLAIFDKPDPMEGPYFEETIYVTPSRLSAETQQAIIDCTARAATALGLIHGPIHAELRVNEGGPWILEVAARSIGGLCARSLRFGDGISLEEVILRHALGMNIDGLNREPLASGVMMIPISRAGVLKEVRGLNEAKSVERIEDIFITISLEQQLVPLPEGNRYLGFIFSRAETAGEVEGAIRAAFSHLEFVIDSK